MMEERPKKARREERLMKADLCKHYDKPGGCPFPNCHFAHGRDEMRVGWPITLSAQREILRSQVVERRFVRFGSHGAVPLMHNTAMIQRYYTELYCVNAMGKHKEDHFIYMHSNRLCVIGIAPTHPIFQSVIEKIEYPTVILESKVSGKKKKGGQWLMPDSVICHVTCKNGITYSIRSCIRGSLIEINEKLPSNPSLLWEKAASSGYIAIIQPKHVEIIEIQQNLLSKAEYEHQ